MAPRPSCLIVSSLAVLLSAAFACGAQVPRPGEAGLSPAEAAQLQAARDASAVYSARIAAELAATGKRSEEHTSELQSLMRISYAVFCLKKKRKSRRHHDRIKYNEHIT